MNDVELIRKILKRVGVMEEEAEIEQYQQTKVTLREKSVDKLIMILEEMKKEFLNNAMMERIEQRDGKVTLFFRLKNGKKLAMSCLS